MRDYKGGCGEDWCRIPCVRWSSICVSFSLNATPHAVQDSDEDVHHSLLTGALIKTGAGSRSQQGGRPIRTHTQAHTLIGTHTQPQTHIHIRMCCLTHSFQGPADGAADTSAVVPAASNAVVVASTLASSVSAVVLHIGGRGGLPALFSCWLFNVLSLTLALFISCCCGLACGAVWTPVRTWLC